jgi:hypothetical protein
MAISPYTQSPIERFTQPASASAYATSGSFSGVDIKVVMHFPVNKETGARESKRLQDRRDYLEERRDQVVALQSQYAGDEFTTTAQLNALEVQWTELTSQINQINQRITAIQEALTKQNTVSMTKVLAELQTISWSIFREKSPVRCLGSVYPRSMVRGPRTIAGTMVFTLFDKSALHDLLSLGLNPYSTGQIAKDHDYYRDTTMLIDQLPPIDLTIIASNEYGQTSYMNLWGVDFHNDGGTFSIEDMFTETVIQYTARDVDLLRDTLTRETDVFDNILTGKMPRRTSTQLFWDEMQQAQRGTTKRRNPYV